MTEDTQDPALGEDTLTDGHEAVQADEHSGDVNWEERYKQLQPTYTKTSQELARLKEEAGPLTEWWQALQSEDTRRSAAQSFADTLGGREALLALLEAEEEQQQLDDTQDPAQQRMLTEWEQFKSQMAEQQQQQQLDTLEKHVEGEITTRTEGMNLPKDATDWIFNEALSRPPVDGSPDVAGAVESFTRLVDELISGYRQTKSAPAPPSRGGSSGQPTVPVGNRQAMADLALQVANEAFEGA